jgi:hypothetical protein
VILKKIITATAAVGLMAAPAVAQSAKAPIERAAPAVEEESQLGGGFLIPLLALGAIILGILVLLDDDDDDPESP